MKKSLGATAIFSLAACSLPASAQEAAETATVEAVVNALEGEDIVSASRMISGVEGFGGEQLFWTPAEAIAVLAGCKADALGNASTAQRHLFLYEWDCGQRSYSGGIAANDDPRSVRLVHVAEGNDAARLLRQLVTMAPPPPIQISASAPQDIPRSEYARQLDMISLRKGERFAQLLIEGDIETLAAGVNEYSEIQYGFRHPEFSETMIEMNGMNSAALVAQVEHIYETLGRPTAGQCANVDGDTECTWQFDNPHYELYGYINGCCTDRWQIGRIYFEYSTPERMAEFGLVGN